MFLCWSKKLVACSTALLPDYFFSQSGKPRLSFLRTSRFARASSRACRSAAWFGLCEIVWNHLKIVVSASQIAPRAFADQALTVQPDTPVANQGKEWGEEPDSVHWLEFGGTSVDKSSISAGISTDGVCTGKLKVLLGCRANSGSLIDQTPGFLNQY